MKTKNGRWKTEMKIGNEKCKCRKGLGEREIKKERKKKKKKI